MEGSAVSANLRYTYRLIKIEYFYKLSALAIKIWKKSLYSYVLDRGRCKTCDIVHLSVFHQKQRRFKQSGKYRRSLRSAGGHQRVLRAEP